MYMLSDHFCTMLCVCVWENIYMCFVCVCPSLMEQLLLGPWVCPRTWPAALTPNSPLNLRSPYTQIHMQSLHTHTFTWYASPSQCNQGNVMCLPLWGMRVWLRSSHLAEERRGEERRGEERRGEVPTLMNNLKPFIVIIIPTQTGLRYHQSADLPLNL